jgi:glycosidase
MSTKQTKPKYPDTLFGPLSNLSRRAGYQSQRLLGVHHYDRVQIDYFQGKADLIFHATTHSRQSVRSMYMVFTLDNWATRQKLGFMQGELKWDTLTLGWLTTWQAQLQVPEGALLRYCVYATLSDGSMLYADNQETSEENATQFAQWLNPRNLAPQWSKSARIYQIFVDRFNPGQGRDWLQTDNLLKPFGGTLRGVIEKLDHIQALGFNTIWLTPIFSSPSHHGYDISDYTQIEPRLGTEADLSELISLVHQKGMRILLDFVANHSSDQHPVFQKGLTDRAFANSGWFTWKKWPGNYISYFGVKIMPEFDLRLGSPARAYLLEAAQKWLRLGVDGYRLDYAIGPDRDFWVDFQRACLHINPECWTFGEVVAPADKQAQLAGSMHGTLDFLTTQALRETFAQHTWDATRLAGYLQASQNGFPVGFSRPAFLDNHDMNRFIFAAEGNLVAVHAALSLLYLLPQPPIVYYGTEFDLSQQLSIHDRDATGYDEARLAMPWDTPSMPETARLLRELSDFREANPWLTQAIWQVISVSADAQQAEIRVTSGSNQLKVSIDTSGEISVNFQ